MRGTKGGRNKASGRRDLVNWEREKEQPYSIVPYQFYFYLYALLICRLNDRQTRQISQSSYFYPGSKAPTDASGCSQAHPILVTLVLRCLPVPAVPGRIAPELGSFGPSVVRRGKEREPGEKMEGIKRRVHPAPEYEG